MRTIKFRGKEVNSDQWVHGFYTQGSFIDPVNNTETIRHLIYSDMLYDVAPTTVGQFTGLYDKDGKEIFEGDILEVTPTNGVKHSCVVNMCNQGYWSIDFSIHEKAVLGYVDREKIRIIGNIHDNPERWKGGNP